MNHFEVERHLINDLNALCNDKLALLQSAINSPDWTAFLIRPETWCKPPSKKYVENPKTAIMLFKEIANIWRSATKFGT